MRIETDSSGKPSGTLADANASIVVVPPAINTDIKGTFATPFSLSAGTTYHLVIQCSAQSSEVWWALDYITAGAYADGTGSSTDNGGVNWSNQPYDLYFMIHMKALQSYSEATIKTQGSYALKAVAEATDSLNKTLTKTF
jgi:hypothetical protein